jgi:hypothetical protein
VNYDQMEKHVLSKCDKSKRFKWWWNSKKIKQRKNGQKQIL